jgi:hypothetical protein
MPTISWIPVLAALQAVEYGTQLPLSRRLVLLEAVRRACQICYTSREAPTALCGEHAPTEEAVRAFQARVLLPAFEKAFEQGVQRLCLFRGEPQLDGGLILHASALSPGRSYPG